MTITRRALVAACALIGLGGTALPAVARGQEAGAPTTSDQVRRVTVEETQKALADGSAVLVDVRGDVAYAAEHVKGSINAAPGSEAFKQLPKEKLIIAYCT